MADGPSTFRSWQDELNLNGEQEQQYLDRALAEAQQSRAAAGGELDQAGNEARLAQDTEARDRGVTTTNVTNTGSYRDYLALKVKAEGQYKRAVTGEKGVTGMIRRQRAQAAGVNEAWTQQGDQMEVREKSALDESAAGATNANRLAGEAKLRADQKATDEKARTQELDALTNRHRENVYRKYMDAHANGGGTEDRTRYAQMLSGAIDEGWKLPGQTTEQKGNAPVDRRGWGIERDAWGTPSKSFGRGTTKKGTAY